MPSLGDLKVNIGADVSGLKSGARDAEAQLTKLSDRMKSVARTASMLGVAAGAAGVAIVTGLVKAGLRAIDAQAKLARATGSSIDALRGLQIAGEDAGLSAEVMSKNVAMLNRRLGMIATQGGPAEESLKKLGLSVSDLTGLDADQRMAAIADRVHALGLSSSATAALLGELGIRGHEMVDFMRQGGDAIRAARQEVDDFGLSLSEVDAAKVEAANDAMSRISRVLEGIRNQITVALAPLLQEVADRFNGIAKENRGFADQAKRAAEIGIRGFAKLADIVQGLRVVIKGVELVAVGFGAAMASSIELSSRVLAGFLDAIIAGTNVAIAALNKLPKVDIAKVDPISDSAFMRGIRAMGEETRTRVGEVRSELHELAMQEMPSSRAEEFLQAVQDRAEAAAQSLVDTRSAFDDIGGELGPHEKGGKAPKDDAEAKAAEREAERLKAEEDRLRESLEVRLQAIREYLMNEEELADTRHGGRVAELTAALEQEVVTEEEYRRLREELEGQHAENLREIRERAMTDIEQFTAASYGRQAATIARHMTSITSGVASESRKMFEVNKIAGIASAIVSTHEGIAKTLSAYPYPVSVAMAAAQAAAGFAQVNAIRKASFSKSGGVAPSLAGGTAAPPTSNAGAGGGGQRGTLVIEGLNPSDLFSGSMVRQLMERAQDWVDDGGQIQISGGG